MQLTCQPNLLTYTFRRLQTLHIHLGRKSEELFRKSTHLRDFQTVFSSNNIKDGQPKSFLKGKENPADIESTYPGHRSHRILDIHFHQVPPLRLASTNQ